MNYFIANGASVTGNVTIEEDVNIWYNATVRGNRDLIIIHKGTNIQDNAVVHTEKGFIVEIGEMVSIGHGAIIHGCTIGNGSLIGMGSIIMNGAKIGNNCIIGAGSLITQNVVVPDNSLVLGSPAKVIRSVTKEEIIHNLDNANRYIQESKEEPR